MLTKRKTGVILSYILMIAEVLSTLLLTPFIIRTLGQSEYGVYKLVGVVSTYLLLLDLGIGNAVVRFASKFRANSDNESIKKLLGVVTIYYIIISIITIIIGFVLFFLFPLIFAVGLTLEEIELGRKLLIIIMINAAFTLGTTAYHNYLIAYEKFAFSRISSIISIVIRITLVFLSIHLGFGSISIVLIQLFLTILFRIIDILYVLFVLKIKPTIKNVDKNFVKSILFYSAFILLQMIATQISASVDSILIGSLVQSSSIILGIYGVGTQIVQYYQSIGSAFNDVLMPGVVEIVEKNENSSDLVENEMIKIGRIIIMCLGIILIGFIFFGKDFIILWTSEENLDAYYVSLLLMIAYTFTLSQSVGTQALWAKNEQKELSFIKIGIVILNVLLTVFLVKWNPLIGATIGTFLSLFLGDVVLTNVLFKIKLKVNLWKYYAGMFKKIWFVFLLTAVVAFGCMHIPIVGWIGLAIKIFVICAFYSVSIYFLGMNNYEKNVINNFFLKFKKKKNN
ncbi:MAG: oligosaccharide flippase family protein [Bacilli bacterium]|nr:oligosaccharide flippase family protein [Bacilli bacterium]